MWLEKRRTKWIVAWREGDWVRRRTAYTDKAASMTLMAKMLKARERGEQDLIDKFEPHKRQALADVIGECAADLTVNGRDSMYVYSCKKRLAKLAEFAGWNTFGEMSADGLRRFRAAHAAKLTGKTLNQYAATLKSFCEWCVDNGRLPANLIGKIKPATEDAKRRRRAMNQDELHRLLTAAPLDRRIVYLTAVCTGLRRDELAHLQWGDLRLNSPTPHIKLRASATKARRADTIAVKVEAADELRKYRPAQAEPTDPVFPRMPRLARFIQDLDNAEVDHGFQWIKKTRQWKRNPDCVQVDFHSLRKTLNTMLLVADVNVATGMKQMRLTDRKLYDHTYADKEVFDTAAALAKLPDFKPVSEVAAVAATGTVGKTPESGVANGVARHPKRSICVFLRPVKSQRRNWQIFRFPRRNQQKTPAVDRQAWFGKNRGSRIRISSDSSFSVAPAAIDTQNDTQLADLHELQSSWHRVPEAIRAAVLLLVRSAVPQVIAGKSVADDAPAGESPASAAGGCNTLAARHRGAGRGGSLCDDLPGGEMRRNAPQYKGVKP